MAPAVQPWLLLTSLAALVTGCSTQFDFDLPAPPLNVAGGAGYSSAGDAAAGRPWGLAGGTSGATTNGPAFPNAEECQHHCKEYDLVCAIEWLRCAECSTDGDCASSSRKRCDTVLHRCIECGSNLDCATGHVCEPASRRCVLSCDEAASAPDGSVADDVICPRGMTCNESARICASCASDGDCNSSSLGNRCHPSMQQCVACLADGDCRGDTPFCDPVRLACVACRDCRDCGNEHCDVLLHVCK